MAVEEGDEVRFRSGALGLDDATEGAPIGGGPALDAREAHD